MAKAQTSQATKKNKHPKFAEASSLPIPIDQRKAGFVYLIPTADQAPSLWRWTTSQPDSNWVQPLFNDKAWLEGQSSFGTEGTPGTEGSLHTTWDTKDIWIRRQVKLPAKLGKNLRLIVHHDNHAEVYLDGILAWRAQNIETRTYEVFEIRHEALAKLKPGSVITIAAHGHNGVGGQVLDVGLVNLK
ncbi:MAG: hypothetical protein V4714_22750 [Bacteroidota bacterium]